MSVKIKNFHRLSDADLAAENLRCMVNIERLWHTQRRKDYNHYINRLGAIQDEHARRRVVNKWGDLAYHPCRNLFTVEN